MALMTLLCGYITLASKNRGQETADGDGEDIGEKLPGHGKQSTETKPRTLGIVHFRTTLRPTARLAPGSLASSGTTTLPTAWSSHGLLLFWLLFFRFLFLLLHGTATGSRLSSCRTSTSTSPSGTASRSWLWLLLFLILCRFLFGFGFWFRSRLTTLLRSLTRLGTLSRPG
uniref:Uncharacterized protein n=1 Tax=Anopheles farauti TaxID=69004 RepID=A0A182QSU0_9DIPT